MTRKKQPSISKIFWIGVISTLFVCLMIFLLLFVFKQIRTFIAHKNYKSCLEEQTIADQTAVTYIPSIDKISWFRENPSLSETVVDHIIIEGKLHNSNIEKLEFQTASGGNDAELIKIFQKDEQGAFMYEISTKPDYDGGINPRLGVSIIPKNASLTCSSASDLATTKDCSLQRLHLEIKPMDNSWCIGGLVDIGLGSAPLSIMTEEELETVGLDISNICSRSDSTWRNKCRQEKINLIPQIDL